MQWTWLTCNIIFIHIHIGTRQDIYVCWAVYQNFIIQIEWLPKWVTWTWLPGAWISARRWPPRAKPPPSPSPSAPPSPSTWTPKPPKIPGALSSWQKRRKALQHWRGIKREKKIFIRSYFPLVQSTTPQSPSPPNPPPLSPSPHDPLPSSPDPFPSNKRKIKNVPFKLYPTLPSLPNPYPPTLNPSNISSKSSNPKSKPSAASTQTPSSATLTPWSEMMRHIQRDHSWQF